MPGPDDQDAGDEDHALDQGDPAPEAGQIVMQRDDDHGVDHRPEHGGGSTGVKFTV